MEKALVWVAERFYLNMYMVYLGKGKMDFLICHPSLLFFFWCFARAHCYLMSWRLWPSSSLSLFSFWMNYYMYKKKCQHTSVYTVMLLQVNCLWAIALQLLLKLKRHLKVVYSLNDARCLVEIWFLPLQFCTAEKFILDEMHGWRYNFALYVYYQAFSPNEPPKPGEVLSRQNIPFDISETSTSAPSTYQDLVQRYQVKWTSFPRTAMTFGSILILLF